ncbi:protein STRUBBELIG-RECEPTOR FAMILY 3-like [Diospyros lotus]|uniref:protein STRUBBELIG-RECEPTOR FAMILY 3-like n=1 Tax=Diospyros lotus TaxID=55363 RepID=UPI0022502838|nr:protein STRUBBELIG-RECEPTOR FAMILY 3-like [Diospyros lotus]
MMASKRSAVNCLSCAQVFTAFVLIYAARLLHGYTNPADVAAINGLYAALGCPSLPGWVPNGGDPCTESWQGVVCNNTDISSIILIDANLGGELGDSLSSFSSIKDIQLSNNNIGGSIPSNLPVTLQTLFLSDNELSGSIPSSLSSLTLLFAMSLNGNQLTGEIPDAFQDLIGLFNLDLSSNNLSGQLPPSLENLSCLTTLHLQNNQLSGTLDVLQDLTLKDLNIENNLFNGPIPDKLLSIPNFKKDGNPFTPLPSPTSPTTPPPPPPFSGPPCSGKAPGGKVDGPCEESNAKRCKKTTNRVVWISTGGAVSSFIILVLTILRSMPRRPELPIFFVPIGAPEQPPPKVEKPKSPYSNSPAPTCLDVPQCTCPPPTRVLHREFSARNIVI